MIDQKKVGFASGAADYLIKPIRKPVLMEAIRKHVPPQGTDDSEILLVDEYDGMRGVILRNASDTLELITNVIFRQGVPLLHNYFKGLQRVWCPQWRT
jgi:DNA-binding response OmpR family regulator